MTSFILLFVALYVAFIVTRFLFYENVLLLFQFIRGFGLCVYWDSNDDTKLFQLIIGFLSIQCQWKIG